MEENNINPPVQNSENHVSAWVIVFLLLFFWPLALYFMYKDKKYHSWIAILLIISGLSMAVINWYFAFLLIPQVTSLYKSLNIDYSTTAPYVVSLFMFVGNLAAAILGIVLFIKLRDKNADSKKLVTVSSIALILSITLSILGPIAASGPLYNLIEKLSGGESPQKTCTMEARLCPDGSSVGRTGPNCEFSPCPATDASSSAIPADWRTYNATVEGFSIKYPDSWIVNDDLNSESTISSLSGTEPYQFITFTPISNPDNLSIEDKLESLPDITQDIDGNTRLIYSDMTIDSIPAKKAKIGNPLGCTNTSVFVSKNSKIYHIKNFCSSIPENLFDQILSTLKFTK